MATLSAVPTSTAGGLTAEQILMRMPNSSADELQAIHGQLYNACQDLQRIEGGQLVRLLGDDAMACLKQTLERLRQTLPPLAKAISVRAHQQSARHCVKQTLCQTFGALTPIQPNPQSREALLHLARWMLIAETDLHFSWLLTPKGYLDFFEQEQPRLLRFLTQYVLETLEQHSDYSFNQGMAVAIEQLREILSRPLNKTEIAVYKRLQEELSVELSNNVVRLNTRRKPIKQGEHP